MSAEVVEYMSSGVHEYIITVVDFCSEIRKHRRTGVQTNTREQEYSRTLVHGNRCVFKNRNTVVN